MNKMKLGELKISCMKLIEVQQEDTQLESLNEDIKYNAIESINRAINRIIALGKYPKKSFRINNTVGDKGLKYTRYAITELIEDFYLIDKVTYLDQETDFATELITFNFEDDYTLVLPTISTGEYIIRYTPLPQVFTYETNDEIELVLPRHIAEYIPYFVKAEIYEEEQPNIAALSRNIFENYILGLMTNKDTKPQQKRITTKYRF